MKRNLYVCAKCQFLSRSIINEEIPITDNKIKISTIYYCKKEYSSNSLLAIYSRKNTVTDDTEKNWETFDMPDNCHMKLEHIIINQETT